MSLSVQLKNWLHAIRPRTLTISVAPVLAGTALAGLHAEALRLSIFAAALLAAVMIQVGTNLHNDVADYERGGDDPATRLGPPRATAEGWLTAGQVRAGAWTCFLLALLVGLYLVIRGGWPILLVGLVCIGAGWAYSGGARPVAYSSLGELFVLVFFGLVAVMGSYYLQTGTVTEAALLTGIIIGMPAAAVLLVNNYRDLDEDRRAGRRTFTVRFGRRASRLLYTGLVVTPFLLLPLLAHELASGASGWLPLVTLPWGGWLIYRFWTAAPGPRFNTLLAATAQMQLALSAVLAGVWFLT